MTKAITGNQGKGLNVEDVVRVRGLITELYKKDYEAANANLDALHNLVLYTQAGAIGEALYSKDTLAMYPNLSSIEEEVTMMLDM